MSPRESLSIIQGGAQRLRDHLGHPVPDEPCRRLVIQVIWGSHWITSDEHTISQVNGRSFYVSHRGQRRRLPRRSWRAFLEQLARKGPLRFVYQADFEPPPPARDQARLELLPKLG